MSLNTYQLICYKSIINRFMYLSLKLKKGRIMLRKRSLACLMAIGFVALQSFAQTPDVVSASPEQPNNQVKASTLPISAEPQKVAEWTPFEVGFWFDVPGYTQRVGVNGFRLGLPFSGTSPVRGLDLSLFGSDISDLDGAQMSVGFCNTSSKSYGLQAALGACLNKGHFDGIQVSLFNKADISRGWQIGGANLSDDVNGSQLGIVDVTEQLKGGQVSLLASIAKQVDGFQLSLVNVVTRNIGPQIGLINVAERSNFQIGLFNINEKSPMPFMILFNFSN